MDETYDFNDLSLTDQNLNPNQLENQIKKKQKNQIYEMQQKYVQRLIPIEYNQTLEYIQRIYKNILQELQQENDFYQNIYQKISQHRTSQQINNIGSEQLQKAENILSELKQALQFQYQISTPEQIDNITQNNDFYNYYKTQQSVEQKLLQNQIQKSQDKLQNQQAKIQNILTSQSKLTESITSLCNTIKNSYENQSKINQQTLEILKLDGDIKNQSDIQQNQFDSLIESKKKNVENKLGNQQQNNQESIKKQQEYYMQIINKQKESKNELKEQFENLNCEYQKLKEQEENLQKRIDVMQERNQLGKETIKNRL